MSNIRIERATIKEYGLNYARADHLSLTFQQDPFDNGQGQERWWLIEGTLDRQPASHALLGVSGVNGLRTLSEDNGGLTGAALRDVISTPWWRGSTILPSFNPLSDWGTMAAVGREIDFQQFSYLPYHTFISALPTANSSSVIASLLYYIGIDIAQNMPSQWISFTVGTTTLLGTTQDDTIELEFSFDTLLTGEGDDRLAGTDSFTAVEKFYGGAGDDIFTWSHGFNIFHGGQPDLDYALDGRDRVDYAGVGTVLIELGDNPIPHLAPDFIAIRDDFFFDKLFSIEELSWFTDSDTVLFGEGVLFENLRIEMNFQQETPQTRGDTADFSAQTSGLLSAPSDNSDVILIGSATTAGGFTDGGIWARSLEWLIGSAGDDRIYAGSTLLGVEGSGGHDVLSGLTAQALTGASPLGYDVELSGGEGDDTIISGVGRSLAIGGPGADTFVLGSLSDSDRTVEFVIEGADTSDRLLVPFNFLVPDAGPFDGSELFPILGAISPVIGGATFGNLPQNSGSGPLGGYDAPGFFYLAGQVPLDGTWSGSSHSLITITDQIVFNRDGSDLLIHVWAGSESYSEAFLSIDGQNFSFQTMDRDAATEAVIRVVDFSEGMLGIHFYELGEETPFPFPGGPGAPNPEKIFNAAQFELRGDPLLRDPLNLAPETPSFDQPSEGETETRDLISGTGQADLLIAAAFAQTPGQFVTGADLFGGGGNDQLTGGTRRDTLDGGAGDDILIGGRGDDRYIVDSAGDSVIEGAFEGFDSVVSSVNYALPDHVEDLTLTGTATFGQGNEGNNLIRGTENEDTLVGAGGDDRLVGGRGDDILDGGTGDDLYVYQAGDGNDTIVNGGADGGVDALKVYGFAREHVQAFQSASGTDVILRFADGARIVLQDFFAGGSIAAVGFEDDSIWDATAIASEAFDAGPLINDAPVAVDDLGLIAGSSDVIIAKELLFANDRDVDGDELTIVAVESLTPGISASLTLDGDVHVVATASQSGAADLTYTVSDGRGGATTARIDITLVPNQAPVLTGLSLDDVFIAPGFEWIYEVSPGLFIDPDGDPLLISADLDDGSGLPEWLTFDVGTQRFEGIVPELFAGTLFIRLTASDGFEETSATFSLSTDADTGGLILIGTSLADVLTGSAGDDEIYGLNGHDILSGGDGDDIFWTSGNAGLDTYDGGNGFDAIVGSGGDDVIGVRAANVVNDTGETIRVLLAGIEAIHGGDGYDVLKLENAADYLDLSNVIVTGIELIFAGGGPDTIIGSAGDDVIDGGGHHDILFGGDGDDTFLFTGSAGWDFYDGGDGFDRIIGTAGDDILAVRRGSADLVSIEAIDFGDGFDILRMHNGDDILDLSGVDVQGLEQIEGGAGADWIRGSSGNEILIGGSRQDTFVFSGIFGQDTIADFQLQLHPRANGDLIDLSGFEFDSFLDVMAITQDIGGHSVIQFAAVDSSITILNVTKSQLEANDFLL